MIGDASRAAAALLPALALTLSACAVNPVTGETELALISEEQEVAMGRGAAEQVAGTIGLVQDDELQRYVSELGLALARSSERPELPWEFRVVDDPTPNAFALPGGYIFVTRGLMTLLDSEAELVAVLGHEIGHVTARHSVSQMSRAQLAQLGLGIGMIAAPEALGQFGDLANTGVGLLFLKYGRDDERQADQLGFEYMLDHGYDVREMEHVFVALQSAGALHGQSALPSWLASHPSEPERIENLRRRVASLDQLPATATINASEYLSQIDGLAYGENPRHGFFEGDWFYHPEMAFQFMVPETWQRQNLATAVLGRSPMQDAVVQLTLVDGTAEDAARAFLGEGVAQVDTRSAQIGGHDAYVTHFRASGQGGSVEGLAAHIDDPASGNAYRLLTYADQAAYPSYSPVFSDTIASFSRVTEPSVLERTAPRIGIVQIEREMTLSEFAERYPSPTISLEELAVINQVDLSTRLRSGSEAKRVSS